MPRRALPRRLGSDQTVELADHLGELRQRLVLCLVAYVPAFVLAFAFHERIVELLAGPLPDGKRLVTLGVTEPFTTSVKVSLVAALALTLPLVLSQVWAFFAPALTPSTQRAMGGLVVLATALFGVGVAFAYAVVLPRALTVPPRLRRAALRDPGPRLVLLRFRGHDAAGERARLPAPDRDPRPRPRRRALRCTLAP